MNGFDVKVNRAWTDAGEEAIVRRVALVIIGHDKGVVKETEHGLDRWQVDVSGNNWWARFRTEEKKLILDLDYRYGSKDKMDALQLVLNWLIGNWSQ